MVAFYNSHYGESPEDWYAREAKIIDERYSFGKVLDSGIPLGTLASLCVALPLTDHSEMGFGLSMLVVGLLAAPAVLGITAGLSGLARSVNRYLLRSDYRFASTQLEEASETYDSLDTSVRDVFEQHAEGTPFEMFTRS